jgi:hypothetical protein
MMHLALTRKSNIIRLWMTMAALRLVVPGMEQTTLFAQPPDTVPHLPDSLVSASESERCLYFDILLGRQFLSAKWEPYPKATNVTVSCLRRIGRSPSWIDGSLIVAWGGELGPDGERAGPGTSLIEIQAGLGRTWIPGNLPLTFYAAGGLAYVWANFELPDYSLVPLRNPMFPDELSYPDMAQTGNFFGGYLRTGVMFHVGKELYIGLGILGRLTTNRNLLGRNLNINSTSIGLSVGARN